MAATVPMSNNNVQFSTYLSWKLGDSFDVDVVEIENRRIVNKIYCKFCRKHGDNIRLDCQLKSQAKTDCATFAEGSINVVKLAVTRHIEELLYETN